MCSAPFVIVTESGFHNVNAVTGAADHDREIANGLSEYRVIGRQPRQRLLDIGGEQGIMLQEAVRGHPIRFDEDDVDADRKRPERRGALNQLGQECPGPRPLTELFESRFVDIDDRDGKGFHRPWRKTLVCVEYCVLEPPTFLAAGQRVQDRKSQKDHGSEQTPTIAYRQSGQERSCEGALGRAGVLDFRIRHGQIFQLRVFRRRLV